MRTPHRGLTMLVNPAAGRGRAAKILPKVSAALAAAAPDAQVSVIRAGDYAEAEDAAKSIVADAQPGDSLVVVGGDGMIGLGINAVAGTGIGLGMIPAGTGNDICRGLGIPLNPVAAARLIGHSQPRPIDTTEVRGRLARGDRVRQIGSVVATGFDAKVNRRANAISWPIGSLRYAAAVLIEVAMFQPLRYRLTIDGHTRVLPAMFIAVANAGYFGGGIYIAPDADPTDGLLDVTVIHPVSRRTLLRMLPTMFRGRFVHDPCVERFRVSALDIDGDDLYAMGDGEELGEVPLSLRANAGALLAHVP